MQVWKTIKMNTEELELTIGEGDNLRADLQRIISNYQILCIKTLTQHPIYDIYFYSLVVKDYFVAF